MDALQPDTDEDSLRQQQERLRAIIRRYQDIDELTPSLLFELIERIEVGQYIRTNGKRQGQAAENRDSLPFSARTLRNRMDRINGTCREGHVPPVFYRPFASCQEGKTTASLGLIQKERRIPITRSDGPLVTGRIQHSPYFEAPSHLWSFG